MTIRVRVLEGWPDGCGRPRRPSPGLADGGVMLPADLEKLEETGLHLGIAVRCEAGVTNRSKDAVRFADVVAIQNAVAVHTRGGIGCIAGVCRWRAWYACGGDVLGGHTRIGDTWCHIHGGGIGGACLPRRPLFGLLRVCGWRA